MPEGRTILSTGQLEHFKIKVDERSMKVTGKVPSITSLEGYEIPISTRQGLPYIRLRPYTDKEWNTLPRIALTSPHPWTPSVLDSGVDDTWYDKVTEPSMYVNENALDEEGRLITPQGEEDEVSDHEDREDKPVD
jgi:hypothetical protein